MQKVMLQRPTLEHPYNKAARAINTASPSKNFVPWELQIQVPKWNVRIISICLSQNFIWKGFVITGFHHIFHWLDHCTAYRYCICVCACTCMRACMHVCIREYTVCICMCVGSDKKAAEWSVAVYVYIISRFQLSLLSYFCAPLSTIPLCIMRF